MEQSLPNFAKEAYHNLKNSFFQNRYYAQMDAESENEEDDQDMSHSLFYSVHQNNTNINNEDSIPLTLSNAYSDRSQLLFDEEEEEEQEVGFEHSIQEDDHEESPVSFVGI
jgi:hypothetical protein